MYFKSCVIVIVKNCQHLFILHAFFPFIFEQLQDYAEYMGSHARVVLVPSVRDANHDFVFPQVMFLFDQIYIVYICSQFMEMIKKYITSIYHIIFFGIAASL